MLKTFKLLAFVLSVLHAVTQASAAPFTTGNLVIYRIGTGTVSLVNTGNPVFLDEYTPAGVLVQSIALPTAVDGAQKRLIASGTAVSEGLMSRSANGGWLVLPGYDATPPHTSSLTGTTSALVNRVIGRVDGAGGIDTSTALTDAYDANNFRGVCSNDGTQFWTAGNGTSTTGGVRYISALGGTISTKLSSTNNNLRAPLIFNGQLHVSSSSGSTVRLGTVGTGLPTTGQTITTLPGYPVNLSPNAFYLADLNAAVAGVDTLYIADDDGTTGGLLKYSFDGTTWTARGTVGVAADGYRGLTASVSGTTVSLYAVRKGGSTAGGGGELVSLVDATGSTGTLTGTPALLAAAAANTAFRGVAFSPSLFDLSIAVSAPASAFTTANFSYTITLTNTGLMSVANVGARFTLPAGTSFVSASGTGFTASHSAGVVTFSGGTVNGSSTAALTVTVSAAAAGTVSLTAGAAVVDPGSALTETDEANNSSTDTGSTVITNAPDLKISVAVPAAALAGANFDYTITLSNTGLTDATGVDAQFTLPTGLTFVNATGSGFTTSESSGVVSFTGGSINAGASATLTVTATTTTDGTYTASMGAAVADLADSIVESNESNNNSTAAVSTVITTADPAIALAASGTFQAGEPGAGYIITVSNAGTGSTSGTITVSDTLPTGLTATSLTGTGWTIVQGTGGSVSATRSDALAAGSSYPPLALAVDVALNAPASVQNTVTLIGGGGLNTANDSSSVTQSTTGAGPGVIAFAAPPALPALFSDPPYIFNENAGSVTIPLIRTGGRTGEVSVRVSTSNGSATAPSDFDALTDQLVTFPDNVVNGSVTVRLVSDTTSERNEDFRLLLGSTGGGATLGTRTQVAVRIIEPDTTKPKLTMDQPKNGEVVTDSSPSFLYGLLVKAKDYPGSVRSAEVSVNGGGFIPLDVAGNPNVGAPPDETIISGQLIGPGALPGLELGTNTLVIRAKDYRGNVGEVTTKFTLVRIRPLDLTASPNNTYGTVSITPPEPPYTLQIDKTYTLKATPAAGKAWEGWVSPQMTLTAAGAASTSLTFTMSEGLTIQAVFVDDPFKDAVVGSFNGLITATGATTPSHGRNGFITVQVARTGSFTGTVKIGGLTQPIAGLFDNVGVARFGTDRENTLTLGRPNQSGLVLALTLDLDPSGTQQVTGTLGEITRTGVATMSRITADRAAFDGRTPLTSAAPGFYTFALPAQAQTNGLAASTFPQGDGIGSLGITKAGVASFTVTLADGTTATASAPLSSAMTAPIYTSLYAEQGSLGGWLHVDHTRPDTDVSSVGMVWFKPHTGGQHYPHGWPEGVTVPLIGALYAVPVGESILPDLSTVSGANALLSFNEGGLTSRLEKGVKISTSNTVANEPVTDTTYSLKLTPGTGHIAGTFTHADATKPAFTGVVLQKGENRRAFGHFLTVTPKVINGGGLSGSVSLKTKFNPRPTLVISEFMAKNVSTITDADGDYSDWIEIYNPGANTVDLNDWCLTDNAANLTKWRFPNMDLASHEFLLVWASNKNRTTPGQPLHTNFALSVGGEYLALVRPDGVTIEHEFAPLFPAQADDESYGVNFAGSSYIAPGAAAKYLVPTNAAFGTTWTSRTFNDANWSSGKVGIGFGAGVPGFTVRHIAAKSSFVFVDSLAKALSVVALPKGSANIASEAAVISQSLNFLGDGGDGHYDSNTTMPQNVFENYVIKATGIITIPTVGSYVFGLNSDDGGRIRIDNVDVMVDDSNHGPQDHLSAPVSLTAGAHTVEVIMWEGGGGDELEFFAKAGTDTDWNDGFKLVGGVDGLTVTTPPLTASSSSVAVSTNVQSLMLNKRPDCYVRVPFTASNINSLSALTLRMRYNDGFVAYLNGTEVARRNAPIGTPAFNATATAARDPSQTLTSEVIDLSGSLSLLVNGRNVLAIQGMNNATSDNAFLVLPELSATNGLAGDAVFFTPSLSGITATPGALNGVPVFVGKVGAMTFSVNRGTFSAPFSLTISSATPGASIRYTLDGTTPTASHGTLYTKPLTISKTSILRALAIKTGFQSTDVVTQTYLFLDDVIRQSATGAIPAAGWPNGTVNGQVSDYGMDPDIVNSTNPQIGGASKVKEALAAIPTISLVTDLPNLFDPASGIWVNSGAHGFAWERPCSVELIGDQTTVAGGFQINCGVRVRGGFSRSGDNPKHAFHLYFRTSYGDAKLNYPLFGDDGAKSFEQFDLRTAQNYSWSFGGDGNNTFIREETTRELQGAMGDPHSRDRYFHLYLNGQYWGLYGADERTEASFCSTYLGGSKDEYDVVKGEQDQGYVTGITDGTIDTWQDLWNKGRAHAADATNEHYFAMQGKAADGVTPTTDPVLLDVDNLIDYMLLTFWTGNLDGCTSWFLSDNNANNWFGARRRTGTEGFKFFAHDFEHTFLNVDEDRTGPFVTTNNTDFRFSNPMFLHHDLRPNAEYRMRWADRVHQHLFNAGVFVTANLQARMNTRANLVEKVIIAESARWGDSKTTTPLTRLDWLNAKNYVINDYVPNRSSRVLAQLRIDGLYPSFDAPTLSQFGGPIASGGEVVISGNGGTIYYTLDGTDPRLLGGEVNATAHTYTSRTAMDTVIPLAHDWKYLGDGSDQGTAWRGAAFDDSAWSHGSGELGYGDGDETTGVPFVDADPITSGVQKNATTYFRTTVNLTNVSAITAASVSLKYDDSVAVYINGVEALRTANLPANPAFNQYATSGAPDENAFFDFVINPALFTEGVNTIAAEVHQVLPDSSDISFALRMTTTRTETPVPLLMTGTGKRNLKVRALQTGEWSALVDATFQVRQAADLSITTIHNGTFSTGNTGSYSITASNHGTVTTSGAVTVTATLPAGLIATSLSGAGWTIVQGTGSAVTAARGDALAADGSYPALTLNVSIAPTAPAFVTTVATVSGGGDITSANNSASDTAPVDGSGPSQLTFSAARYDVREEAGSVPITILRTGTRTGSASVQLRTANGTAKAPDDYEAQNGTVVDFADSEASRTVTINVSSEAKGEPNETFTINISNVTGAASFGPQITASVRIIAADEAAPTVSITTPTANARVINTIATVTGSAADNKGVASVQVSINGSAFTDAITHLSTTGTTATWTAPPNAIAGANTVTARSIDTRGLISTSQARTFFFVPLRPLALTITPADSGTMSISPNTDLAKLQVGVNYTLKAIPKTGFLFDHWTTPGGNVEGESLTITMTEGLAITATFAQNLFKAANTGIFNGLVKAATGIALSNSNHGFITLTVSDVGAFTGTLKIDGLTLPFAGRFNNAGDSRFGATLSPAMLLPRTSKRSLVLDLHLDLASHKISGHLGEQDRSTVLTLSTLSAERPGPALATSSPYLIKQGRYTLTLPAKPQAVLTTTDYPSTSGTGTLTILKAGTLNLVCTLADSTRFTASASLTSELHAPLFAPLYSDQGSFNALIILDDNAVGSDLKATDALWFRPASNTPPYPLGWPEGVKLDLIGVHAP